MRIGILTDGGDYPGLNAVIAAVVRKSVREYESEVIGFLEGWRGLIENLTTPLPLESTSGILPLGGTILKSSPTNPFQVDNGPEKIMENMKKNNLDALIGIGDEDTCAVGNRLFKEHALNVVLIPKTMNDDLNAEDYTLGVDTCVNTVIENIDRLHTTAQSHDRILVCEVIGPHAGWIARCGGIAGGADFILVPEKKYLISEVTDAIKSSHAQGKKFSIIVIAEGAKIEEKEHTIDSEFEAFGHVRLGSTGERLAKRIEQETKFETRATVLGHIQRGCSPTAFDKVLATRFGIHAAELVHEKKFGRMVSLSGNQITDTPISDAVDPLKTLDMNLLKIAEVSFV